MTSNKLPETKRLRLIDEPKSLTTPPPWLTCTFHYIIVVGEGLTTSLRSGGVAVVQIYFEACGSLLIHSSFSFLPVCCCCQVCGASCGCRAPSFGSYPQTMSESEQSKQGKRARTVLLHVSMVDVVLVVPTLFLPCRKYASRTVVASFLFFSLIFFGGIFTVLCLVLFFSPRHACVLGTTTSPFISKLKRKENCHNFPVHFPTTSDDHLGNRPGYPPRRGRSIGPRDEQNKLLILVSWQWAARDPFTLVEWHFDSRKNLFDLAC